MGEAGLKRDHPVLAFLARDKCVLRPACSTCPCPAASAATGAGRPLNPAVGRAWIGRPSLLCSCMLLSWRACLRLPCLTTACPLPACHAAPPIIPPNCRHARSLSVFREGLEAFRKAYPFLVTTSLKANAARR